MKETWVAKKVCLEELPNAQITGIAVDNNGTYYLTRAFNYRTIRHGKYCATKVFKLDNMDEQPKSHYAQVKAEWCGIAWEGSNLYACDQHNHKIVQLSDSKTAATRSGETRGYKDGLIEEAQFSYPRGIAVDKNGDLIITEFCNVRKITKDGHVFTLAGCNQHGHKDGDSKTSMFHDPWGIFVCKDGTVFVCDTDNHCIRKIKNGIVSTIAGTPGKEGNQGGALLEAQFQNPRAIQMDADGNLLIGDLNGLKKVELDTKTVSRVIGTSLKDVYSLCQIGPFEFLVGTNVCSVIKMVSPNTWKWERWLWLALLKHNPCDCILATLPRDIIKLIATFFVTVT